MRKTTKGEGKIEVLRGRASEVLNEHFAKTGKYAISDFNEEEKDALELELDEVKKEEESPMETRGDVVKPGGEKD
jgi:hypothetical protein